MSIFQEYIPYLKKSYNDKILTPPENVDINEWRQNNVFYQDLQKIVVDIGKTDYVYLLSFLDNTELKIMLTQADKSGALKEEYKKVILDIIASIALKGLWKKIVEMYGNLSPENLEIQLKNKKNPSLLVVKKISNTSLDKEDDFLSPFINKLNNLSNIQIKVEVSEKIENGVAEFQNLMQLLHNLESAKIIDLPDLPEYIKIVAEDCTDNIINKLRAIYAPCFEDVPLGLLTNRGILSIDKKSIEKRIGFKYGPLVDTKKNILNSNNSKNLYNNLSKLNDIDNIAEQEYEEEGKKRHKYLTLSLNYKSFIRYNYYIDFHISNIYGYLPDYYIDTVKDEFVLSIKNRQQVASIDELLLGLKKSIFRIVYCLLYSWNLEHKYVQEDFEGSDVEPQNDLSNASNEIFKRLTNIAIIMQYNDSLVDIVLSYSEASNLIEGDIEKYFKLNHKGSEKRVSTFFNNQFEVTGEASDETFYRYIRVLNKEKAAKEILFAYKQYDKMIQMGKPLTANVILGRNEKNMTPFKLALGSDQAVVNTIIAGSGSGKGVLTLAILASLYAAKCPVMYVDYKPEMAATLWNMDRENNSPIYAVDGLANNMDGIVPIEDRIPKAKAGAGWYDFDNELVSRAGMKSSYGALMPYLKSIQLLQVLALLRNNKQLPKGKKALLVLDEAQTANSNYSDMVDFVKTYLKEHKKETDTPEYKAIKKINDIFIVDLLSTVKSLANATGRVAQVGMLLIGQQTDPSQWSTPQGTWKNCTFGFLIGNAKNKLIGANSGTSPTYGLNPKAQEENKNLGSSLGYWMHTQSSAPGKSNDFSVFKSYLILNDNDFDVEEYQKTINTLSTEGEKLDLIAGCSGRFTGGILKNCETLQDKQSVIENDYIINDMKRDNIGFAGMMRALTGSEYAKSMSVSYELFDGILRRAGIIGTEEYPTIESYLYSANPKTFFTPASIVKAYTVGEMRDEFLSLGDNVPETIEEVEALLKDNMDNLASFDEDCKEEKAGLIAEIKNLESKDKLEDSEKEKLDKLKKRLADFENICTEQKKELEREQKRLEKIKAFMEKNDGKKPSLEELGLSQEGDKEEPYLEGESSSEIQINMDKILADYAKDLSAIENEINGIIFNVSKKLRSCKEETDFDALKDIEISKVNDNYSKKYDKIEEKAKKENLPEEQKEQLLTFISEKKSSFLTNIINQLNSFTFGENISFAPKHSNNSHLNSSGNNNPLGGNTSRNPAERPAIRRNEFKGETFERDVETGDIEINTDNLERIGNVKELGEITAVLVKDIINTFGGKANIKEITITATGGLLINGYKYQPKFGANLENSIAKIPYTAEEYKKGNLLVVCRMGQVLCGIMESTQMLCIEDVDLPCDDIFLKDLGVNHRANFGKLFRKFKSLQAIYLPDEELTRDRPESTQSSGGGLGLGAKLANLFNFGGGSGNSVPNPHKSNSDYSLSKSILQSKPVKVLGRAFGWTIGCKAVVLAATLFGPWGLLFGTLAAVGTYREIKEDRANSSYKSSKRSNNGNSKPRNNNGGRNNNGNNSNNGNGNNNGWGNNNGNNNNGNGNNNGWGNNGNNGWNN